LTEGPRPKNVKMLKYGNMAEYWQCEACSPLSVGFEGLYTLSPLKGQGSNLG